MEFKEELQVFCSSHPLQETEISGSIFHYLLCGREDSPITLLYFVGGTGNPLSWYGHVLTMETKYRVLLLDYPMGVEKMDQLTDLIGELLQKLSISRAVFIGASFGGYVAQLMAKKYPERTAAMVLYATTALTEQGIEDLKKQYHNVPRLLWIMEHVPYGILKGLILKPSMYRLIPRGNSDQSAYLKGFVRWICQDYTKEKDLHMTRLMTDLVNVTPAREEDYSYLKGKVLLVLPREDKAFTPKMQQDLQKLLQYPAVESLEGGHLATLFRAREMAQRTDEFLKQISI